MRKHWQKVRNLKLCYNCLNKDHKNVQCNFEKQCNQCTRRHNRVLHYQPKSDSLTPSTASHQSNNKNVVANNVTNEKSN